MTQAERLAALSTPKIRDERITPGCHKYKPPVRGLAYRGSVEGMTYKHRDAKLATKSTDGKEIQTSSVSLSGDAYDAEVRKEMEAKMGGVSDCATGGGRVVFGKYQKAPPKRVAAGPGAGPSKATQSVRMDGSAPGRAR